MTVGPRYGAIDPPVPAVARRPGQAGRGVGQLQTLVMQKSFLWLAS